MGLTQEIMEIPVEHMANIFGQFDSYLKKIEKAFQITIVVRDGGVKLLGEPSGVEGARFVLSQLIELSKRGNEITQQNVNYLLDLAAQSAKVSVLEMDTDIICHTIQGKPVKPKTLGQKDYVQQIRDKMIVFGMGPAGT